MPTKCDLTFQHLGNPEFWEFWMGDPKEARTVAKLFTYYWLNQNEIFKDFGAEYTLNHACWDVYHWGMNTDGIREACKKLFWAIDPRPLTMGFSVDVPDGWEPRGESDVAVRYSQHILKQIWEHYVAPIAETRLDAIRRGRSDANEPLPPKEWRPITSDGGSLVRGGMLVDQGAIRMVYDLRKNDRFNHIRWGPALLPYDKARKSHFCTVGMPRSGKTVLFRLLLESLRKLPLQENRKKKVRVVAYDKKTDFLPFVTTMTKQDSSRRCFSDGAILLNPFDIRSSAWDIAADANSLHCANEIARLMISEEQGDKSFYVNTPRALLAGVIMSLRAARGRLWNLMDLLIACRPSNLRGVLRLSPTGRNAEQNFLTGTHGTPADVLATLAGKLTWLEPVAAAWDRTENLVSIREWSTTSSCDIVLGDSDRFTQAMRIINQILLQLISESLLDNQTKKPCDTFLLLDELQNLGRIDMLPSLLSTGASLGVTAVLGLHDLTQLNNAYGEDTEGLLGMCGHYAFLRVNARDTAKWASDQFGEQEVVFHRKSSTESSPSQSEHWGRTASTTSPQHVTRPVVSVDEIMSLPLTSAANGLAGYFKSYLHPAYRAEVDGELLFGKSRIETSRQPHSFVQAANQDATICEYNACRLQKEATGSPFLARPEVELEPREHFRHLKRGEEIERALLSVGVNAKLLVMLKHREELLIMPVRTAIQHQPDGVDLVEFPQAMSTPCCRYELVPPSANDLPGIEQQVADLKSRPETPEPPDVPEAGVKSESDQEHSDAPESQTKRDLTSELFRIRRPKSN